MQSGKIVAKTPPFQIIGRGNESIIYVWIQTSSGVEKFSERSIVSSDTSTVTDVNPLFLVIAASDVGDAVEIQCTVSNIGTSRESKKLFYIKNLYKPYLR